MTKKQLQKRIEELEARIAMLEARPYLTMPVQPMHQWLPMAPYVGDPLPVRTHAGTITCVERSS